MNHRVSFLLLTLFLFLLFNNSLANTPAPGDSIRIEKKEKNKRVDKWWGMDKAKHFILSAFLAGVSYKIYYGELHNKKEHSLYFSGGFTFSLGLGKEIYAETRPQKKFSYKDLVYDLLGIGVGLLIASR